MLIKRNLRATDIKNYLNQKYAKRNGKKIELTDVQGYIRRGQTPHWLGNFLVQRNNDLKNVHLYNLKSRHQ